MRKTSGILIFAMIWPQLALAISGEDRVQFADSLYVRGMYDLAIQEYGGLVTNQATGSPSDVLLFRLAESYRHLGNKEKAAEYYGLVIDRFKSGEYVARAKFRRAELYVAGGSYLEAINLFRGLLDGELPEDVRATSLYYLGYAQNKVLLFHDAAAAFKRVLDEHASSPFYAYACIGLAEIYARESGKEEEVLKLYRLAAEKPETPRVGAEALFQMGEYAFRAKKFKASAEAFDQLFEKYPTDERIDEARLHAAWSYHNTKRYDDALRIIAARSSNGKNQADEWLYLQANCLRQLKRHAEARGVYAELLKNYTSSSFAGAAVYEDALVAFQMDDFQGVIDRGQNASVATNLMTDLYWLLAESSEALKRDEAATKYFKLIAEKHPADSRAVFAQLRIGMLLEKNRQYAEAAANYQALLKQNPDEATAPDALLGAVRCYAAAKNVEDVLSVGDQFLKKFPKHKDAAQVVLLQARAQVESKQEKEALQTLDRLLKQYPDSSWSGEAHYLRGVLFERTEDFQVAEYHYRAALTQKDNKNLDPQEIRFRQAVVLQKQGKHEEAARLIQGLLGTEQAAHVPVPLLDWLARWNLENSKYKEAVTTAEVLIQRAPDNAWRQIGWYLAGRGYDEQKNDSEANEAFLKALAIKTDTREGAESALRLGHMAGASKKYADAEKYYRQAAEAATTDERMDIRAKSYYGLAQTAYTQERWDEASRYFLSVGLLFDDPTITPECLYRAADALGRLGRDQERDQTLNELRQRYPDSSWSKKSLRDEG